MQTSSLAKAKMRLMTDAKNVFFIELMCSLDISVTDEIPAQFAALNMLPTAWTDGIHIKFHSAFIETLNDKEILFVLMHELMHVALMHPLLFKGKIMEIWLAATDYWINDDLERRDYIILEGATIDSIRFNSTKMSTDEIYAELFKDHKKQKEENDKNGNNAGNDLPDRTKDKLSNDVIPNEGTKEQQRHIAEQIKDVVVKAAIKARMSDAAGSIPNEVQRVVDDLATPKADWATELQAYMFERTDEDYTWKRRNRRYRDIYLPSLYSEQMGEIEIYIDSSISVSDDLFKMQFQQVRWIKQNMNPKKMNINIFNTEISERKEFMEHEELNMQFIGSGGTDIAPVMTDIIKRKPQISIIFTDGYFYNNYDIPTTDILWGIYNNKKFKAPCGKMVVLPHEKN